MEEKFLFDNIKICQRCQKPLPKSYPEDFCARCKGEILFEHVRDYIRENDVNEHDVAEHFNIPLSTVKSWIQEGRIEYKEDLAKKLGSMNCFRCGAPVQFGTICVKCMRAENAAKGYGVIKDAVPGRMRFTGDDDTPIRV